MNRYCGSRLEGCRRDLLSAKGPIRRTSCNAPAQPLQAASLFAIAGVTHKASCPRLGFPDYSFCLTSVVGLMMSTAPTSAYGRDGVVVEDWEHLRPNPAIDVDFSGRNSPSRLHDGFILSATGTKITFPVRGSLYADNCGPEMSDMTKKLHRAFTISVLHFSVSRTHRAQRLNPALDALCHSCAFLRSQIQ